MKIFSVYQKSHQDDFLCIAQRAFSIHAWVFGPLWALYQGMWRSALVYVLFLALAACVSRYIDPRLLLVVYNIWLAVFGWDLMHIELVRSGYSLVDIVCANNDKEALLRHFKRGLADAA